MHSKRIEMIGKNMPAKSVKSFDEVLFEVVVFPEFEEDVAFCVSLSGGSVGITPV